MSEPRRWVLADHFGKVRVLSSKAADSTASHICYPEDVIFEVMPVSEHEQAMRIADFDATVPTAELREAIERLMVAGDWLLGAVRDYAPSSMTVGSAIRAWEIAKREAGG